MVNLFLHTKGQGSRERAEANLGRERTRLQTVFHSFETHVADANDNAGSLARMFCSTSSFSRANNDDDDPVVVVQCVLILDLLDEDDDDDDSASLIVVVKCKV